jgi:hypothetical protein
MTISMSGRGPCCKSAHPGMVRPFPECAHLLAKY